MAYWKMHLAAVSSLMYAIVVGITAAYSSTATEDMKRSSSRIKPDQNQVSWIGSLIALGALCGGICAGYLSNKYGRKGVMIFSAVPFMLGWLLIAYAPAMNYIFVGRFLTGFCVGLMCVVTPIYVVEISLPDIRGRMGAFFQLYISLGVFLVAVFGMFLTWSWLAISGSMFTLIALLMMYGMPESPRWLVSKDRQLEALNAIQFLRGNSFNASSECLVIVESISQQPKGNLSLKELSHPSIYKPALLSVGLFFFQQFSGSNAILSYTVSIFKEAGSIIDPRLANIYVTGTMLVSTYIGAYCMDVSGRKKLLFFSGFSMCISLLTLGIVRYISQESVWKERLCWVPLVCLILYIAAFSVGYGPIPWLMMPEMTPLRARSFVCGACTAICWTFVFIITKTFGGLEGLVHDYGAYWFYAIFCFLSCIFSHYCLPETKGRTFEQVEEYFNNAGRSRLQEYPATEVIA